MDYHLIFVGLLLLIAVSVDVSSCSNILVFPFALGFNSRLFNMQKMSIMMAERGHNVTLLINSRSRYAITTDKVKVIEYSIPAGRKTVLVDDDKFQDIFANKTIAGDVMDFVVYDFFLPFCRTLLEKTDLIEYLKQQQFDLFFIDALERCGHIIAEDLDVPTLLYSNYGFNGDTNLFYPMLPSFIPLQDFGYVIANDKMTFLQRVFNFLIIPYHQYNLFDKVKMGHDEMKLEFGYGPIDYRKEILIHSLVIATIDFALDLPRPIMPHIIPISGLFLEDVKPLNSTWRPIVDDAPEAGIILMSLGSIMFPLDSASDEMWAGVFASLPQHVIWKHSGPKPRNLGSNTHLTEWMPQSDLLAHPKVKLFITHCGMSSTYEAVQCAVPVLAIPIAMDQQRNAAMLVRQSQMGIQLDLKSLNKKIILSTIESILSNETFQSNAKKISVLVKDKPIPAKDLFLYWVEYAIRHQGATHLISEAALELNFLQFHSVDVVFFLLALVAIVLTIVIGLLWCCVKTVYRTVVGKNDNKRKSD